MDSREAPSASPRRVSQGGSTTTAGSSEELREALVVPAPSAGRTGGSLRGDLGSPKRCPQAVSVPARAPEPGLLFAVPPSSPGARSPLGDTPGARSGVREWREHSLWGCRGGGAGSASGEESCPVIRSWPIATRQAGEQRQSGGSRSPDHSAPLLGCVCVSCGGICLEMGSLFISGKLQNQSRVCHKQSLRQLAQGCRRCPARVAEGRLRVDSGVQPRPAPGRAAWPQHWVPPERASLPLLPRLVLGVMHCGDPFNRLKNPEFSLISS